MSPLYTVVIYLLLSVTSASDDHAYCAIRYTRLCQEKGQHIGCQYPDVGPLTCARITRGNFRANKKFGATCTYITSKPCGFRQSRIAQPQTQCYSQGCNPASDVEPGPGESCENHTKIEFTAELKNFVLNYINRRRQRIAAGHERVRGGLPIPKPDIMMYVEWDRELAYLAQRLADQCRFVHDECRATVRYPYAGQTVGEVRWRRSLESDELTAQRAIRKVFDAWWGEKRRVQPQQLTTPFRVTAKGTVWGHFSQLAIWKLRAIGCGAVRHGPPHPRLLLVCDYSHTNMLGQKTISAGPLATCPPHTARRPRSQYPLLCSTIKYPVKPQEFYVLYDYDETPTSDRIEEPVASEEEELVAAATELDIFVRRTRYDDDRKVIRYSQRKTTVNEDISEDIKIRKQFKNEHGTYQKPKPTSVERDSKDDEYRMNVEDNHRPGYFQEKRPHLSEDYSVIPLRNRPSDQANAVVASPWRPKLFWRTSTSDLPGYETSVISPGDSAQNYDKRFRRPSSKAREKVSAQHGRRPLAPSLKLDKEDIYQLFKDTGFKPNWTPKV